MKIPVLGIPFFNRPDLLLRCIASIDNPVKTLVLIENGGEPLPEIPPNPMVERISVCKHPNAGVAGAWNEVIMLYPSPWWMLVNNDIQFTPGDLAKMSAMAWHDCEEAGLILSNQSFSFFIITRRGVANAGLFDPMIHPAYYEDNDAAWRMNCAGEKTIEVPTSAIHGELVNGVMHGSRTIGASDKLRNENSRTFDANGRYYAAKTGGYPGHEKFKHPFNNPNIPINYVRFDPEVRAEQQWSL
jgi:GT2 family glycosyltransferase